MKALNAVFMLIGILVFFGGLKGMGPSREQDQALTIAGAILVAGGTVGMSVLRRPSSSRKETEDK